MELLTQAPQQQPLRGTAGEIAFSPVVRLFMPDAAATWLLTEIDPDEPNVAFGLCDLWLGCPEPGPVSPTELGAVRGHLGLPVERDLHFAPAMTLSAHADDAARRRGHIQA